MRHPISLSLGVALVAGAAACSSTPPSVAPAPAVAPATASAAATERARVEAANRAATTRTGVAHAAAATRADVDRRAHDAADVARGTISAKIFFDFDSDALRPDQVALLDAKLPLLSRSPALRIRIAGNADDRGSEEYNLALGQRRAAIAKRYLVDHGIDATRIDVVSFGNERPVCRGEDDACWSQNRRDEFVVVGGALSDTPE